MGLVISLETGESPWPSIVRKPFSRCFVSSSLWHRLLVRVPSSSSSSSFSSCSSLLPTILPLLTRAQKPRPFSLFLPPVCEREPECLPQVSVPWLSGALSSFFPRRRSSLPLSLFRRLLSFRVVPEKRARETPDPRKAKRRKRVACTGSCKRKRKQSGGETVSLRLRERPGSDRGRGRGRDASGKNVARAEMVSLLVVRGRGTPSTRRVGLSSLPATLRGRIEVCRFPWLDEQKRKRLKSPCFARLALLHRLMTWTPWMGTTHRNGEEVSENSGSTGDAMPATTMHSRFDADLLEEREKGISNSFLTVPKIERDRRMTLELSDTRSISRARIAREDRTGMEFHGSRERIFGAAG